MPVIIQSKLPAPIKQHYQTPSMECRLVRATPLSGRHGWPILAILWVQYLSVSMWFILAMICYIKSIILSYSHSPSISSHLLNYSLGNYCHNSTMDGYLLTLVSSRISLLILSLHNTSNLQPLIHLNSIMAMPISSVIAVGHSASS